MAIKTGDKLPTGTLWELIEEETPGCSVGPNSFEVGEQLKGKRVAIFGLPGAFTPTCSAKHLPGFVSQADQLKAKGINEIWCLSVNDAFVMGAWGREQGAKGKVRMMADGSGAVHQSAGAGARSGGARAGRALPALLDAGRRWRGEGAESGRAGQVRREQCREDVGAGGEGDVFPALSLDSLRPTANAETQRSAENAEKSQSDHTGEQDDQSFTRSGLLSLRSLRSSASLRWQ